MTINELSHLAHLLSQAEREYFEAELKAKKLKERARFLREETLPSAMHELGVDSIQLDTGATISIKQEVYASIPIACRERAYKWLVENGFDGLIKTKVVSEFTRGERAKASKLYEMLNEEGYVAGLDETIHPQTLKAFIREQLAAGNDIPLELFGARPTWVAKVK